MRTTFTFILLIILLPISVSAQEETRNYHLGFTPFPHDISFEAVNFAYDHIATDADIIAHHFDDGIPWIPALNKGPYPDELIEEWQTRLDNTPETHKIYVAITPINLERNALAPFRGTEPSMTLPPAFADKAFNDIDVKRAYLNHAGRAIDFFQPDYLAIGIEVNLLLQNNPDSWDAYVELHQETHTALKQQYPDLPIFVSVFGMSYIEGVTEADTPLQLEALNNDILPYTDIFGISLYPFMSAYLTDSLPDSIFDTIFSLSDKPIAITETGYPAQSFSIFDETIIFNTSAERQNIFVTQLLAQAEARNIEFIINFILRDYDALWEKIGGGDINAIWRDTGFYDEDGNPRPALHTWLSALSQPYHRQE